MKHVAMTVAGSDTCGGAGIQADLKTFAAQGVYGTSVITALTAQNTQIVADTFPVPAEFVALQMKTVAEDIDIDAVKTGMLVDSVTIETVAGSIRNCGLKRLVVDPVMISKSGAVLLAPEAVEVLLSDLFPMAMMVTPNIPEAETLSGTRIENVEDMKQAARKISETGTASVLVKGGHMTGAQLVDVLLYDNVFTLFRRARTDTPHTHGTGCALSAAITAGLARGLDINKAVESAEEYIDGAIRAAIGLGKGHGPVNHFFRQTLL